MNSLNQKDYYFKETILKKFPYLSYSPNLIENFLIIGYDDLMISKKIINDLKQEFPNHFLEKATESLKYRITNAPTILSSISADSKKATIDEELLISLIFPNNPCAYVNPRQSQTPKYENIIFFINSDSLEEHTKISFHGYGFVFYEPFETIYKVCFIPKVFAIISQFPLFNVYNTLCRQMLNLMEKNKLEIPLEILVYNLVNFTPSPINFTLQLSAFPSLSLTTYSKDYQSLTSPQIKHNQQILINPISGYPILDFNVYEIFNLLPIPMIVEIFIFNFLEFDMLFFSENLELLNIVMYLFSSLSYPCNDTLYLWHIVSVNAKEITNLNSTNRFVGKPFTSMVGINCTYNESIKTYDIYNTHFVVDLDKKNVSIKYNPTDYKMQNSKKEIEKLKKLKEYIRQIDKKNTKESVFLKGFCKSLTEKLQELAKIIPQVNVHSLKSSKDISFFNQDNKTHKTYSKEFQEIFYTFIMNLMKEYYSCYTLDFNYDLESLNDNSTNNNTNNTLMQSKSYSYKKEVQNLSSFYEESNSYSNCDLSKEENLDIVRTKSQFYSFHFKEHNENYPTREKEFNTILFNTQKYLHYTKDFLLDFTCFDVYKIQLSFFDEFMIFKNKNMFNNDFSFFDVMDSFYTSNNKENNNDNINNNSSSQNIVNINFNNFYEFYEQNLKMLIFKEIDLYPKLTPCVSNESDKQIITYIYKSITFDKDLLLKYVYYLSNIPENHYAVLFPSLKYKSQCQITDVPSVEIPLSIEAKLVQLEKIRPSNLLLFSVIYIASYFFQNIQTESEIQIILNLLRKINSCFRMYLIILVKGLYKLCKEKIAQNKSIYQEFVFYAMIMDLLKEKNILPNKELLLYIENFTKMFPNAKIDENEQQLNQMNGDVKNQTNLIKPTLIHNICHECNVEFDINYFIDDAKESYLCETSEVRCTECQKKIIPLIYVKNPLTKKEFKCNFFTPVKIYRKLQELMEPFLQGKLQNNDIDFLYGSIINLIVYFSDFDEDIELPINFLCKSLLNEKKKVI